VAPTPELICLLDEVKVRVPGTNKHRSHENSLRVGPDARRSSYHENGVLPCGAAQVVAEPFFREPGCACPGI
jgi:hypothetical protein